MPKTSFSLTKEIGYVAKSKEYVVYIEGLPSVKINDIIVDSAGRQAIVNSLNENYVIALILEKTKVKPGVAFYLQPDGIQVPAGQNLLGRTINPLGEVLDAKGKLPPARIPLTVEVTALGIDKRATITEQLKTGISLVDLLLPIGCGQKELIFGEPRSGKTTFLLDAIAEQKERNTICIYGSLGKSEIEIMRFAQNLDGAGASSYSVIVASLASDPAPLIAITPAIAFAIADFFISEGRNVLLILDDLGTHAKYLREIALLTERVPGRESYPGDIFYQHAHLIERAGNFMTKSGKTVSLTLLPIMETDLDSLTTLIPTNLMSITDGHLLFSSLLNAEGRYPAIEIEQSVTRVGKQTQLLLCQEISHKIRSLLAEYQEVLNFSRFGAELSEQTKRILKRGQLAIELFSQEPGGRVATAIQPILFGLLFTDFLVERDCEFLRQHKKSIIQFLATGEECQKLVASYSTLSFESFMEELKKLLPALANLCQN